MMRIELTAAVPDALLEQVVAMDHAAYPPSEQITPERARTLYHTAPDSLILLRDGEALAGYLSVFAIRRDAANAALKQGTPIYTCPMQTLLARGTADADTYLHNVILAPDYRGKGYRKLLFAGLAEWLTRRAPGRYTWADVVSPAGANAMRALGLSPLDAGAHLWRGNEHDMRMALSGD